MQNEKAGMYAQRLCQIIVQFGWNSNCGLLSIGVKPAPISAPRMNDTAAFRGCVRSIY